MFGCRKQSCAHRRGRGSSRFAVGKLPEHQRPSATGPEQVPAAREFVLTTGETLAEASESRLLVLIFLRHFGCTFTRQLLRGLQKIEDEARSHHAELVLVHMLKNGEEIRYLAGHDKVARIADPKCRLYRAFGLGRGGFLELFGPRVWWLGAVSVFKGCGVGHLAGDGLQMPGAFLFRHGRILSAQRAASASDLPDLPSLFSSVEIPTPDQPSRAASQ